MDTSNSELSETASTLIEPSPASSIATENLSEEPSEDTKEPDTSEISETPKSNKAINGILIKKPNSTNPFFNTPKKPNASPAVEVQSAGVLGKLKNLVFSSENKPEITEKGQWYLVKMRTLVHTVNEQAEKEIVPLSAGDKAFVTEINGRRAMLAKPVKGWCNATSKKGHVILELIKAASQNSQNNAPAKAATEKSILSRFTTQLQMFSGGGESLENSYLGSYCVVGDNGVTVRETQALDSKLLGTLHAGTFVNVVMLNGRRAKIDRPKLGWVSLRTADGSYDFLQKREEPLLEKEQLLVQIEALKKTNSNLENALKGRDRKISSLEKDLEKQSGEIKAGHDDILELKKSLQDNQEDLDACKLDLTKLEKSNENFERLFQQRELDLQESTKHVDRLKEENEKLLKRLSEMERDLMRDEVRRKELERDLENSQKMNGELQMKFEKQTKLVAAYHFKLVDTTRKYQTLAPEFENEENAIEEEIHSDASAHREQPVILEEDISENSLESKI